MEMDAHCFSDSDTEYNLDMRSNSLFDDDAADAAGSAWAHPYEDLELIEPPIKIELREFPVVDLAREAETAKNLERKINGLSGACGAPGASNSGAPGLTRLMGKGSWTIKVTQNGGVGKLVHKESPGPDRRAIVPCVDKDGAGSVMLGTLGGDGWAFFDVARSDRRAMSLLWPKEKCGSSSVKGGSKNARLQDVDISEMTPEERLQRERRDEKNRKERERRALLKLEKQKLKAQEQAAAAAQAQAQAQATATEAAKADSAAPCGPGASSEPNTPGPGTPSEMTDVGTPQTVSRVDISKSDFPLPAHVASSNAVPAKQSTTSNPPTTSHITSQASSPGMHSTAPSQSVSMISGPVAAKTSAPTTNTYKDKEKVPASSPAIPASTPSATSRADSNAAPKTSAVAPAGVPTSLAHSVPVAQSPMPAEVLSTKVAVDAKATSPVKVPSPVRVTPVAMVSAEARKEGSDAMQVEAQANPADKENQEDDEKKTAKVQERGRCVRVEDEDDKQTLSKRRRIASLSPVEVNCRAGETKRTVRPRGVQRA